jgi:ABC-type uncharacterized transport system involved in gliding motility auxiliary subunit
MDRPALSGLILLGGVALLAGGLLVQTVIGETIGWSLALVALGGLLTACGACALRAELGALLRRRRGEIVAYTVGVVGVLVALAYLSARYPVRIDLTTMGRYSLSEPTITMLDRLDRPVHITFFHDPLMRETVELYELMAARTKLLTVEFHDPVLNPAQARLAGVQFAGTALMESEGRRLQVHGNSETDIANGILRVSRSATQRVCFLDGHAEADPFSLQSHDHLEGAPGHVHGLGVQYELHEQHGMAKARQALETLNYTVAKVSLVRGGDALSGCAVLVVAGPKVALLPAEVAAVDAYLVGGGHAFFLLDPFVRTGLEPILRDYGIVVDDDIILDQASHFWADVSAPAVSDYNRHQVTRDLPLTFFPGVRSLSPTPRRPAGTSVIPLVNSSKQSWGQTERARVDAQRGRVRAGPKTLMAVALRRPVTAESVDANRLRPGDDEPQRESSAGGEAVTRPSRIAVIGDSDFAPNSFFHIMGNGTLFLNAVNYLAAQENLIGLQPRTRDLPRVNLTNRQVKATFVLSLVLVPALLAVVGTTVWWRQR